MTKLFSMKTLAFAGAAAFALTLAAAPKADAAVNGTVNYQDGTLTVTSDAMVKTADGFGVYFGNGKTADKAKKNLVVLPDVKTANDTTTPSSISYDISNLLGKEGTIVVAEDAAGTTSATVALKASPKATAKDLSAGILKDGVATGKVMEYKFGTYGKWSIATQGAVTLSRIEDAKILGNTMYIHVADGTVSGENVSLTTPWSKDIKIKIKAKAKAPKIAVKAAKLTKEFTLSLNKYEYKTVINGDTKPADKWIAGAAKANWETLLKDTAPTNFVKGDALAGDVTLQVRTKGDDSKGKAPSQIAVVDLKQSPDSPTQNEITVKLVDNKKKGASVSKAAISAKTMPAGYMGQYALEAGKWKNLTKEVTIDANKTIYLRLVGDGKDKKMDVLPSAVATVVIPQDGSKTDAKITATGFESKNGVWAETTVADWK